MIADLLTAFTLVESEKDNLNDYTISETKNKLWIVAEGLEPQEKLSGKETDEFITITVQAQHILSELKIQRMQLVARGHFSQ